MTRLTRDWMVIYLRCTILGKLRLFLKYFIGNRKMKNRLSLIVVALLMFGCASTSVRPENKLSANAKFLEPSLKVNLMQKLTVEGYPDQSEFSKLLQQKTIEALKAKNLIAEKSSEGALLVEIVVDYQRRFAGEDTPIPSKSVMMPIVHYRIVVSGNGIEKRIIDKDGMTVNRGFGSNLATTFTLGLGKTAKDELKDLEMLANGIASEVEALKER